MPPLAVRWRTMTRCCAPTSSLVVFGLMSSCDSAACPHQRCWVSGFASGERASIALSGAGFVADPDRLVSETYAGVPDIGIPSLSANKDYARVWRDASEIVARWLDDIDTHASELNEPLVARTVVAASNDADVRSSLARRCQCVTSSGGDLPDGVESSPTAARTALMASCRRR